jgi:hypothetical protein
MVSSVHHLLTLENETLVGIAPRRAGNDPLNGKSINFPGLGRQSGRPRHQQDQEAADEGAKTAGADSEP